MIRAIFADTAFYLALLSPRDALHARAVALGRAWTGPVVTSAWVVQELADGLSRPGTRAGFLRLLDAIRADASTTLVDFEVNLWLRGLALYRERPDKFWSLTDCVSFEIMRERGLTQALTADHHFVQAGFEALMREG